ncbi:MAG: manganese efflux pump MntP family protein [Candidatus Bathyarchaeota archaeon]|nr:manganese efflux pump MntP family protein [Candidatus Bathyarchaeota archaeon]
MDITILLIAFGLAMDSFSVSITSGLENRTFKAANAFRIGLFFGSFQAIMLLIGWFAGIHVLDFVSGLDHWIAFGLLAFIGCRMVYESTKVEAKKLLSSLGIGLLLTLSVATSIDALAVGLSFSFLRISIILPAIIVGLVAFSLSFLGVYLGGKIGRFLRNRVGILGGLILVFIGIRILVEHLGIA